MKSIVRIAGPADKEEIFRLFRGAHKESGLFPFDLNRVDWWVTRMLQPELIEPWDTGIRGVIGVIGTPKHLEAVAFLVIGCLWYSSQRHLEELIVYVDPKHRHGDRAREQIAANGATHLASLVDWMKEQSCLTELPLMSGVMTTTRTEAKVRLYERMLPKVGAVFRFDPVTVGSSVGSVAVH